MPYRFARREPVGKAIRRIARQEVNKAIRDLSTSTDLRHIGVHEARKRFKKLRSLLRLARKHLGSIRRPADQFFRDVGMRLAAAVEFSFLLGVLTLGGAAGYKGIKYGPLLLETYGPASLAIGFLFAFISAVVAIKWMVAYLNKHGMHLFGYYRVALAVIVAAMLLTKVVAA